MEEGGPEGVDVRARLGPGRARLLRAHVERRAVEPPGDAPVGAEAARRAPVENEHLAVGADQQVLGLDVLVDDAARVRIGQAVAHRDADRDQAVDGAAVGRCDARRWSRGRRGRVRRGGRGARGGRGGRGGRVGCEGRNGHLRRCGRARRREAAQRARGAGRPLAADDLEQGAAVHLVHGEEGPSILRQVDIQDRRHVGVGEACGDARLAEEALGRLGLGAMAQDLERDRAREVLVVDLEHRAAGADPEHPGDRVARLGHAAHAAACADRAQARLLGGDPRVRRLRRRVRGSVGKIGPLGAGAHAVGGALLRRHGLAIGAAWDGHDACPDAWLSPASLPTRAVMVVASIRTGYPCASTPARPNRGMSPFDRRFPRHAQSHAPQRTAAATMTALPSCASRRPWTA